MSAVVEIRDLVKRFGRFTAVDSLSFTIESGAVLAFLGPNGAGKTTTIKLLMGMLQPTSGSIRVCGLDAFADSVAVKTHIGYVPDEPAFYDFMRGREIIRFVGEMRGLDRHAVHDRSVALAERLKLTDALEDLADNYSHGMKKKLALICALLHQPDLLVLDEPTSGLDPCATQVLRDLMREQADAGRTVLYSTHLLDQAERISDRVAVVRKGTLVAEGTLKSLRRQLRTSASLESLFFQLMQADSPSEGASSMERAT